MFFEAERLPFVQKMIMTDLPIERREALDEPSAVSARGFRRAFPGHGRAAGHHPPHRPALHEFLPNISELMHELADLKIRLQHAPNLAQVDDYLLEQIRLKETLLKRARALDEANPMLGMRGVRLGIMIPELTRMQVRAVFEAACKVAGEGVEVHPEVMIPLTSHVHELKRQREVWRPRPRK
jgi:pyruvate, orthophosphate dikinase